MQKCNGNGNFEFLKKVFNYSKKSFKFLSRRPLRMPLKQIWDVHKLPEHKSSAKINSVNSLTSQYINYSEIATAFKKQTASSRSKGYVNFSSCFTSPMTSRRAYRDYSINGFHVDVNFSTKHLMLSSPRGVCARKTFQFVAQWSNLSNSWWLIWRWNFIWDFKSNFKSIYWTSLATCKNISIKFLSLWGS